ncbi:MAG: GGDEF domain-containing protein [Candidatus Eremiobacterota bacterium]
MRVVLGPGALMAVTLGCLPWLGWIGPAGRQWLSWAPWLVFALGAAMALRFYRSNLALAVLVCASLLPGPWRLEPTVVAWLLPVNLVALALSRTELLALTLLLGQGWLAHWLALPGQAALMADARLLAGEHVHTGLLVAGLLALGYRAWRSGSPLDSAMLGLLLAASAASVSLPGGSDRLVWLTAGGLSLLLGLVTHSHRMAYMDELTELPGRRALREELSRLRGRYVIAMLDVDHFKSFNDRYGHDVGDQVLRLVASRLRRAGGGGRAFRYGGEEFTVVFPGKTLEEAWEPLEELRETIEATPMVLRSPDRPRKKPRTVRPDPRPMKRVSVTISIGVAEKGSRLPTPESVLKAADKALYRAKKNGRNQVAV